MAAAGTFATSRMPPKNMYPCGKCDEHCAKNSKSVGCNLCDTWWHKDCAGMDDDYFDQVIQTEKMFGWTGYLCKICCKVSKLLNKDTKSLETKVTALEAENKALKLRLDALEKKQGEGEGNLTKVKEEMTQAKEEVKKEVKEELIERDERSDNLVIYGLKESEEEEAEERKKEDEEMVKKVAKQTGVTVEENDVEVKFRAGKKREDGKPRPLIIRMKDPEKREKILDGANKLGKKDEWKKVYVAPDMTAKQREDDRKKEDERKKEAEEKTKQAHDEGKNGKWMVVGRRGRRRVVWEEGTA